MGIVPLHADRHARCTIGTRPDTAHGARHNHAVLGLREVMLAAADYPVLMMKDSETGAFNIVALFSFAAGNNHYVVDVRWVATWVPGSMLRYPFYHDADAPHRLAIDEDSGLINAADGDPLFIDGLPAPFVVDIADSIVALLDDIAAAQSLAQTLAAHRLVRPLKIILARADGQENQIDGLYTISETALDELGDDAALTLHRQGALRTAAVMLASLNQLERVRQLHDYASEHPLAGFTYAISD